MRDRLRALLLSLLRRRRTLADAELALVVAEVFPHEDGQQLWWESYERRSPGLRRELVADLRRRQARNAAGGSSRQG